MKADWLCCEDGRRLQRLMAHRKPATKLPLTLTVLLDVFSGLLPFLWFLSLYKAVSLFASSNLGLQSQCGLHVHWWPLCGAGFHRPLCVCSSCWSCKFNVWFPPPAFRFLEYFSSVSCEELWGFFTPGGSRSAVVSWHDHHNSMLKPFSVKL